MKSNVYFGIRYAKEDPLCALEIIWKIFRYINMHVGILTKG